MIPIESGIAEISITANPSAGAKKHAICVLHNGNDNMETRVVQFHGQNWMTVRFPKFMLHKDVGMRMYFATEDAEGSYEPFAVSELRVEITYSGRKE